MYYYYYSIYTFHKGRSTFFDQIMQECVIIHVDESYECVVPPMLVF